MTDQEIQDGNKLVAEFMGAFLIYFTDRSNETSQVWMSEDNLLSGGQSLKGNSINGLKFHSSWDWLMPVVEKIESLGFQFDILGRKLEFSNERIYCIWLWDDEQKIHIECPEADSKIEAVYLGGIEFIKWYNKNKEL